MRTKTLGRYRILKELGRGAMGAVYLAHDPQIDRNVAIKTVQSLAGLPQAQRVELRERVLREARSAGKLLHPGIVTLFDAGEAADQLYLAMEYVEGSTLDQFCQPGALLPVPTVKQVVAAVADALDYAHASGVVHRDIKPANLMRVGESEVKIMDFGLAGTAGASLTADGSLLGTPSYMSPEQIRGNPVDGRSDQFSLGIVLFELLVGQRPFHGDTVSSIIYRIVNEEPLYPEGASARIDGGLQQVLSRCLAKQPDARFPRVADVAAALRGQPASLVTDTTDASDVDRALAVAMPDPSQGQGTLQGTQGTPGTPGTLQETPQSAATPTTTAASNVGATAAGAPGGGSTTAGAADLLGAATHPVGAAGAAISGPGIGDTPAVGPTISGGTRESAAPRSSARPFILFLVLLIVAAAAAGYQFREELGLDQLGTPEPVWWEATVRTEPAGLPVVFDGKPLDPGAGNVVRFQPEGPFGKIQVQHACRTEEHQIEPTDAGTEIVLVPDPIEITYPLNAAPTGATVALNGKGLGSGPVELALDLCKENRIELRAEGYRPATVDLAVGVTPLEARKQLDAMELQQIPMGTLVLPKLNMNVIYYVDGKRIGAPTELELREGTYEVRYKNDHFWFDRRQRIQVAGGKKTTAVLRQPELGTLVVQAFPANCKVYLRKGTGDWKYVDETPMRRRIATGSYEVKVELKPTGETREETVNVVAGDNPPLRVAFRRGE